MVVLRTPAHLSYLALSGRQPQGPSGNDPEDLTIANQVSRIVDGAPAIQLITVLLKHIAIDVGNFTRDVHSSSQVYFRSHMIYNDIQGLITKVEGSTDANTSSWDAFDNYTIAIPILERILLSFYSFFYTETRNDRREHLPQISGGVDSAFIFIETWRKDRKMLRDTLISLADTKFLPLSPEIKKCLQANPQIQRSHDDASTIRAFSTYFNQNSTITDRHIVQPRKSQLVDNAWTLVDGIITQSLKVPAAEETSRIVVMSLMITYIPFSMLASDKTDQGWRDYLRTAVIWTAMKNLLDNVDKHLKTGKQPSVSELDLEWEKLKDLLLKLTPTVIDTKAEILELLKLAANIRRPFHGRSVELIRTLYQLDKYSRENAGATRHRTDLKHVIDDSLATLEATRDAVSDVKNITLNEPNYTKHESELNTAFGKVKDIFATFGIPEEWAAKEQAYKLAATIDTDHLTTMRQRLDLDDASRQTA